MGVNCLAEISNLHMRRIADIETYAYVVLVVVSLIIVTRLAVPLALFRFMGITTMPCGDDAVDAMLTVC